MGGMELCPESSFSQHPKCVSPVERVAKAQLDQPKGWLCQTASCCVEVASLALPWSVLGCWDHFDAGSEGFIHPGFRLASTGKTKLIKMFSL